MLRQVKTASARNSRKSVGKEAFCLIEKWSFANFATICAEDLKGGGRRAAPFGHRSAMILSPQGECTD
jgi:hypothetical protein